LTALSEALPDTSAVALDVSVMGSLNALREFGEGRTDIAGFHVPIGAHAAWDREPFLEWLVPRRDTLIRFVDREQGLILARGNPARVRSLRGVVERKLRFVNRQRGSATRILIDRMLAEAQIEPSELEGFGNEEFTHPAVAATVASGGADAGFGLRAAAAEYGLAFVPLVRERYFLAVRAKDASKPPLIRLIDALKSPAFSRRVRRLPGYYPEAAGSLMGVDALAAGPAPKARRR
jgi:molybdate-binding protein